MNDEEVDRLLATPIAELLVLMGTQLVPPGVGIGPEDDDRAESAARAWLRAHWQELRTRICGSDAGTGTTSRMTEFSAVADTVSGLLHGPVVFTATAIIVRFGVQRLCAGDDAP